MSIKLNTIAEAIEDIRQGKMVVMVDDENRENEGDLIGAAELVTPSMINFMATHGRGLICLALEAAQVQRLGLKMMVQHNKSPHQTAFTTSIEASSGVSTGISCADRAHTILQACDPDATPSSIVSPGHVFPLKARQGGVLVRAGHTEGSIDLCRLAGLRSAAVICEIMNKDGTMARLPDLMEYVREHDLKIISIAALIEYRLQQEKLIEFVAESRLPLENNKEFNIKVYQDLVHQVEHVALTLGDINPETPTLVRVHSECLTGDIFGSLRCDCGPQLHLAMDQIVANGQGILLYMRAQEGRGIGLGNKIKAYALQDQGLDTVEANHRLGFKADLRHYGIGAQILRELNVGKMRLLTNNPRKVKGIDGFGLEVIDRVPLIVTEGPYNQHYLHTKATKLGHFLH